MEARGDIGGFLAGHRVGNENDVMRVERGLEPGQLVHQLFVDLQPAGGVYQQRVMTPGLGPGQRLRRYLDRILILAAIDHRDFTLASQHPQLFHCGWTINVSRGQYRMTFALGLEPSRELRNRGRLARALQADDHDFDRRLDLQIEFTRRPAHRVLQLGRDETQQVLLRRERAEHFLPERLASDMLDKIANNLDIDVGFEQREPDFAERIFDIALGDSPLALELLEDVFEAVTERIKHKSAVGDDR